MLVRALYCAILALAILGQYHYSPDGKHVNASPGTKDDHLARWRYQFEKLKDPKLGDIPSGIRAKELAFARTLPSRERMTGGHKSAAALSINWEFRGPENLGGRTRALAVDVANENVLIAGGVSGGMWRSEDRGATWARTSKLSDLKSVTCLAQDTRLGHTNTWYYGTGEARANSAGLKTEYYGDGLSKSTDNGKTWQQLDATVSRTPHRFDDFDYIMNIAVDPSNLVEDEVYCATTRAIYRSVDGGNNWDLVLGSQGGRGSYCEVVATSNGVMYASIPSSSLSAGLYRSTDGIKWIEITPNELSLEFERVVIATAPMDENQVYFLMSTPAGGTNGNTFFKYTYIKGEGDGEGEGQWENRTGGLPSGLETYYSYCMVLMVNENDPELVYVGGMNLYRSTNGFANRTATDFIGGHEYPSHHADQHILARVPGDPDMFYSGSDGGVHRTDNINESQVQWTDCSQGYVTSQFYTIGVDHETRGSNLVMGGLQDNGTWISQADTKNWQNLWGADGGFVKVIDEGRTVFASWQMGVVHRLERDEDGAVVGWTRIDPANAWSYDFINPFAVDPNDANNLYIAEGQNIWQTDEALTMENGTGGPASSGWKWFRGATGQQISAISVSRKPDHIMYFGTRSGELYRVDNASANKPKPVKISEGKGLPGGYVGAISIDPTDAQKVIVAYSNYGIQSMAFTSDAGETWSLVAGNLEENPDGSGSGPAVKWVATLPGQTTTIYFAGTTTGLYSTYKLDGANTVWMLEAESIIGNTVVDMIDVRHHDGFVAVATHGNGVYSATVDIPGGPVSSVASNKQETPSLAMHISPNPSNSLTRIGFELHQFSPVEISIIDMRGNIVFSQRDQLPAGMHAIKWNGLDQFNRPLPSGSYTAVIRTPHAEDKRTLVRIK